MEILDIVCRWPGSVNDACIFSNSRLKKRFELEELNGILLGDSGYPLLPYLYTPLLSPITPSKRRYNAAHATTRNLVERCFGLWKRRFPCLGTKLRTKLRTTVQVILLCAILHNIAIQLKDPVPEPQEYLQAQNDPSSTHYHLHGRVTLERAAFINRRF